MSRMQNRVMCDQGTSSEFGGTKRRIHAMEYLVRRYGFGHSDKPSTGSSTIGTAGEEREEVVMLALGRIRGRMWCWEDVIALLARHPTFVHGRGSRDGGALCR